MEQKNVSLKAKINFYVMTGLMTVMSFIMAPITSLAAKVNPNDALKKAGINTSSNVDAAGLYDDLNSIVFLIMAIGGIWTIACLVFAGMRLSAAQGNPQARTQGLIGIAMAALGLFVIVKAYDIAGWVASLG